MALHGLERLTELRRLRISCMPAPAAEYSADALWRIVVPASLMRLRWAGHDATSGFCADHGMLQGPNSTGRCFSSDVLWRIVVPACAMRPRCLVESLTDNLCCSVTTPEPVSSRITTAVSHCQQQSGSA